jgi:hypothetical protein
VAQSFEGTEEKLNDIKVEVQNTGLKINSQKTNKIRVNAKIKDRVYHKGYKIEEVSKFSYLGIWFLRMEVPSKV